jgi:uncharacterized protein (DUF2267 family)
MPIRSAVDKQRFRCIKRTDVKYDEFLGQVQHRTSLGSHAEAERATRTTLETLAERLVGGEAHDPASQLNEFFELVSAREGVDPEEATLHARVVIGVLTEAVSQGEIKDIRVQLPAAFAQLFNAANEGDLPQIRT